MSRETSFTSSVYITRSINLSIIIYTQIYTSRSTKVGIFSIITKGISKQQIPLYGNGLNIRDWIFVDDHIDAILATVINGKLGNSYCIGASEQLTNLSVVQDICNLLDQYLPQSTPYSNLITLVEDRLGHDQRYAIDSTRIKQEIGWKPRYSFKKGLQITVKWFIENHKLYNKIL